MLGRQLSVLALSVAGLSLWGQAPLRNPDGANSPGARPNGIRERGPAHAPGSRMVDATGRARMTRGEASPDATTCTISTSSTDGVFPITPNATQLGHLTIIANGGCAWTVTSDSWIHPALLSSSATQTITFTVDANQTIASSPRLGRISVLAGGVQQAQHLVAQLSPTGAGAGIAIANFSLTATLPPCAQDPTPPNPIPGSGGSNLDWPVQFSAGDAQSGCSYTVEAADSWVTVATSAITADPTADVRYQAGSYTGQQARSTQFLMFGTQGGAGVLIPANHVVTVTQNPGGANCNYSLNMPNSNLPAAGGPFSFSVLTGGANSGCQWTLGTSNPDWITGVQGQSGTSDQSPFSFQVAANTSPNPRTGYICIAAQAQTSCLQGQTPQISITQAGVNCTPQSQQPQSVGASGGSGTFNVAVPASCQWTAGSSVPWLTLGTAPGQVMTGPETVTFNAAANGTASQQTGYINIQGTGANGSAQFEVLESPALCTYSLSPTSLNNLGPSLTPGSFAVTTSAANCSWTASPQQNWISTNSSGTTSGTVNFTVAANSSPSQRIGQIQVADQTFTITQAGLSCSYTPSLTTINATPGAAVYPLEITTSSAGCNWTAQTNASWISLDTASGSQTASINVSVAAYSGSSSRAGTITIGPQGQVVTVNQSAPPPANNPPATATFSASPNPAPACGNQSTGTTTFTWNASGVSGVVLYAGSTSGTVLYAGAASGTFTSSSITNGEVVILTDSSQNVLGQVTVYLDYSCGATLVQAVMTNQTDFSNGICAVPTAQNTFTNQDYTSTLWFSMQNVPAGSNILAEFIDPYGDTDMSQTFSVTAATPQYCNASEAGVFYDYPNGFVPATLPGGWTARLSLNGQVLGTFPYYISGPLTYAWTFTSNQNASDFTQPPCTLGQTPCIAQTKTFSTNDSGVYTYFSTVNSQEGDVNRLYYFQWNAAQQAWTQIAETDFDPLNAGGVWYFTDELTIAGDATVQQNPGYYGVLGTVTQTGGTETSTFQEVVTVTPPAQLQAAPTALGFTYLFGGSAPAGQSVALTSAPSGTSVAVAVTSGAAWLSASLNSGTTPANLAVYASPAGLGAGIYTGTITVTSPGSSLAIPVTLTVTAISLTSLNPSSAPALSGSVQLQANGQNFTSDAQVRFTPPGGSATTLQTQFQSSVLLDATIPASLLTSPGTAQVALINSLGASNSIPFLVTVPAPQISSLSPNSAPVNGPAVSLTVNGSNFLAGAQVQWTSPQGGPTVLLQTQFQSSALLAATIPASYLTSAGTASVAVSNSGVMSNAVNFSLTQVSVIPTLTGLSPASVVVGAGTINLLITGTNFVAQDVVLWNGGNLPTVLISPTELSATVPAASLLYAGTANVSVRGPTALSNSLTLTMVHSTGMTFNTEIMTKSAPPSNGTCGSPVPATSFLPSDGTAYLYFLGNVTTADNLYNDWVAPDGTVIGGATWGNGNGTFCFTGAGLLIGSTPASRLGLWQARIWDNGSLLFWLSFTVQ